MFLPEWLKITAGSLALIIFALGYFARRHPDDAWLQPFDLQRNLTHAQRARMRRSSQAFAGAEMILAGVIIPMGYLALKVMFFNSPEPLELVIVFALSAVFIAAGVMALVRNR